MTSMFLHYLCFAPWGPFQCLVLVPIDGNVAFTDISPIYPFADLCDLIQTILNLDPSARPSIPTILNHSWVRNHARNEASGYIHADPVHSGAETPDTRIHFRAYDEPHNVREVSLQDRKRRLGYHLRDGMVGLNHIDQIDTHQSIDAPASYHPSSTTTTEYPSVDSVLRKGISLTYYEADRHERRGQHPKVSVGSASRLPDCAATSWPTLGPAKKKKSVWRRIVGVFLGCVGMRRRRQNEEELHVLRQISSGYIAHI